jgi:hypothetical protein
MPVIRKPEGLLLPGTKDHCLSDVVKRSLRLRSEAPSTTRDVSRLGAFRFRCTVTL